MAPFCSFRQEPFFFLFLFLFLFPFLHHFLVSLHGDLNSVYLGSSQEWSQECYAGSCIRALGMGHLRHGLCPQACTASDLWSSQASFLFSSHDPSVVIILGLHLAQPTQVTLCKC